MQLEYFIIGGCTIQVLYSRTMPRVVLAFFDVTEVKKKASTVFCIVYENTFLLLQLYMRLNDCYVVLHSLVVFKCKH